MLTVLIVESQKDFQEKFSESLELLRQSSFDLNFVSYNDYWLNSKARACDFCFIEIKPDELESLGKNKLLEMVPTYLIPIGFSTTEMQSLSSKFKAHKNLKGIVDYELSSDFYAPLFSDMIAGRFSSTSSENLNKVKEGLEKSVHELKRHLSLVKEIHSKAVPKREIKVKGLNIKSKFMSGEKSGGEFFDFNESNGVLTFVLTATNSYLVSTTVLNEFSEFIQHKEFSKNQLEKFCLNLSEQMTKLKLDERESEIDLLVCSINTRTLKSQGYNIGGHKLVVTNSETMFPDNKTPFPLDLEKSYFEFTLHRDDQILIFSSGFYKNLAVEKRPALADLIKNSLKSGLNFDDINEFFLLVKREREEQFLEYDASCIHLSVDKNAIVEI